MDIEGKEYVELDTKKCGPPSGSMGAFFDLKKRDSKMWIPKSRVADYKKTCDEIKADLAADSINWYRTSSEFIGSDSSFPDGGHIFDAKALNQGSPLPPTLTRLSLPDMGHFDEARDKFKCERCGQPICEDEKTGEINDDGNEIYTCSNPKCKYSNGGPAGKFDIKYFKPRERSKTRLRRKKNKNSSLSSPIREAASPASPALGGGNNPANTPFGRLDLSEDQRIIPWSVMQDSFDNEWDSNRQKNNKDFKVVKIKGKDGKIKYVRIKRKTTGGDSVSPANTYNQKGRVKKQPRYNPAKPSKNQSGGSWPHNRDVGTEGWYQSGGGKNQDADMRQRVIPWNQYIRDRGTSMMTLVKPY